ncbi:MAG: lysophospholipid acyltransferase family protein [Kiritimatiellae bacterium]|nr:lysophospholipid acyltransferase family protein [Kiritimatiellia bacterium]
MAKTPKLFRLDTSKIANPLLRIGAGLSRPLIEHTLCFPQLNRIYAKTSELDENVSFTNRVLSVMNVQWDVGNQDETAIPKEGPLIIVANHPFGGIEGLLMISMLERFRPDGKVMANYLLSMMPEIRDRFFFVDPFGGPDAKRANLHSMKASLKWVEEGHALAVFPAGEVSSIDLKTGKVRDPAWSPTIARMVRRTKATVLPVFFTGSNGAFFNMAGLVHPRLRTLLLPKQFVNKRNHRIHVELGPPIPWHDMEEYATDEELIQYLRLRTYVLGERESAQPPKKFLGLKAKTATRKPYQEPIVDAVPPDELAAEIAALPESARLLEAKGMAVYHARAAEIPKCLREIGRLREVTYRAVGEGTNHEIDLDSFDEYYVHLFIWNAEKKEIVGAYRLGLADEICARLGVRGLYTVTCFKYDRRLIDRIQPCIELGRSWVRVEYQRAFSSLLLLWRGICAFIYRNPRYTTLFGPVSISSDYLDTSRNMILRSLRLSNFEKDLARLVRPRHRLRKAKKAEWNRADFDSYIDDLDLVSKMVQDIESDQKGIPILLRQYIKMGGKFLAFNVDPDFNYCLDGLIAVNVPKCDPKQMGRYMGVEEFAKYAALHGVNVNEA